MRYDSGAAESECACMRARALNSPLLFGGTHSPRSVAWRHNAIQFSLTMYASPEFIFASFFIVVVVVIVIITILFAILSPDFGDIYHNDFLFDDAQISLFFLRLLFARRIHFLILTTN